MAIFGDIRREDRDKFIRQGFAAEVTLGIDGRVHLCGCGYGLLHRRPGRLRSGHAGASSVDSRLDLQDYWRWIGFMQGNPKKSL